MVVTVIPTASGVLTNITTATSSTPEANPGTNNLTAMVINTAAAPQVLEADLGLTVSASPNPVVVSNQLTYSLSVTNFGPADAPGVVLDDVLPTNSTFISASNSQGSFTQNGSALHWDLGMITNGGNAEVTFVITPLVVGLLTNSATTGVGGGVIDPNQTNNATSVVVTVNPPIQIIPPSVSFIAGAIIFDPQTGLFEQSLQFNNLGTSAATGVRVAVLGLPVTVTLYNASGSTNGVPYVEYDAAVPTGGTVNFALEYYSTTRLPFSSTNFVATVFTPVVPALPTGTTVALDQMPTLNNGQFLIEFPSTPGATYVIEYSTKYGDVADRSAPDCRDRFPRAVDRRRAAQDRQRARCSWRAALPRPANRQHQQSEQLTRTILNAAHHASFPLQVPGDGRSFQRGAFRRSRPKRQRHRLEPLQRGRPTGT